MTTPAPAVSIMRSAMANTPGTTVSLYITLNDETTFSARCSLAAGVKTATVARRLYKQADRAARVYARLLNHYKFTPPLNPYHNGRLIAEAEGIARCEMHSSEVATTAARVGGICLYVGKYRAWRAGERVMEALSKE